jgi:NAD/NADP transhydrogenase beta subunit
MNSIYILDIIYLIASVTFVLGLKMLSHPDSARKGNLVAAAGMTLAIAGTIILVNYIYSHIYCNRHRYSSRLAYCQTRADD